MIGIFDSGVGGLTVAREIMNRLPEHQIIYFGDTARVPYGGKSRETVIRYAREDAKLLLDRGARIIVIACNTASAFAGEILKKEFPDVPIFEVVRPAIETALTKTRKKKIGVIGTRGTIKSGIYQRLLKEKDVKMEVFSAACPLLVPLAEEGWLSRPETRKIIRYYLRPLKLAGIDVLILACTHYPLMKTLIASIAGKRIKLVDPANEVAIRVQEYLEKNPAIEKRLIGGSGNRFLVSDKPDHLDDLAIRFLKKNVKMELINPEALN